MSEPRTEPVGMWCDLCERVMFAGECLPCDHSEVEQYGHVVPDPPAPIGPD